MIQSLIQLSKTIPLKSYSSAKEWSAAYFQLTKDKSPIDKAITGGFVCQQFSFAFLAGYQAALEKMFPTVAPNELKALCVSEAKGGHPKAIQTTLIDNRVDGIKTYITAGSDAAHLLVLCKTEEVVNGRPLLKMIHLPSDADNTEISNFELPFMLEVNHGKLTLKNTQINSNQILQGDGFNDYAKPFRTLEDVCVGAAYQAMLLRQAIEYKWEEEVRDQIILNIHTLKTFLTLPPSDRETHLLLATSEQNLKKLLPKIESNILTHSPPHFKEDWEVNKRIISLGEKMKQVRLSKARTILFGLMSS